jgi:ribose 5-phosphate isomerase B
MAVIALGADHAGFSLKEDLKSWLASHGHRVLDFGTSSSESVDYPDYAAAVGSAVAKGDAERGVLVCGTGIGMAIAANKIAGVRAVQCGDEQSARISREHNDTNVVTLGARTTAPEAAKSILEAWLETAFAGGRHTRRIEKVAGLEREWSHASAR